MSVFSIECDIVVKMLTKLFSRDAVLENELLTLQMLPGDLATLGKKIEDDFAPSPTGADPHKSTVDAYQAVMNSIHTLPEEVQGVLFRSHLATLRRLNAHKWEYGVNWVYRAVLGHAA